MENKKRMKVEITSRETIGPFSPTSPLLRNFKLSLLDQINLLSYVPIIFFYPNTGNGGRTKTAERCDRLKKSLSKTLTRFYPLAGRIKDIFSIDCNDEGVDYLEAQVNCELSEFLRQPELELLNRFLPVNIVIDESDNLVQLAIQVNTFDCGGFAIALCALHLIIDGSSLSMFINHWAATACGSDEVVSPVFIQDSIYPPRDLAKFIPRVKVAKVDCSSMRTGRFLFYGSNIAALRAKVNNNGDFSVKHPTRVEVVSTLIWQRLMAARSKARRGLGKLSMANLAVNIRRRMIPPLPENSIGNIFWHSSVTSTIQSENEFNDLVCQVREAIKKVDDDYMRKLQGDEGFLKVCEAINKLSEIFLAGEVDYYTFTSWCRFPFYEADFGWGKPAWITSIDLAAQGIRNLVLMVDTRSGDGIEAWVTADEEVMAVLECDEELLAFATPNPSVLDRFGNSDGSLNWE